MQVSIKPLARSGVTLIEMLVVVLIISILATLATGVYTGEKKRAQVVAARELIRQLEIAIARYEFDMGLIPPSGSGDALPPAVLSTANVSTRRNGSGYLFIALVHSINGSANAPASALWDGPYITIQAGQLAASVTAGQIDILDPWGNALRYVESKDYAITGDNFHGGTRLFSGNPLEGSNPNLPGPNPFTVTGETYYNTKSYQIYSLGPDGTTVAPINTGFGIFNFAGTAADDVSNFGY